MIRDSAVGKKWWKARSAGASHPHVPASGGVRKRKYRNQPCTIDGLRFHSKKEGLRWLVLKDKQKHGEIKRLDRQVRIPIDVNGVRVATYVADFVYDEPLCRVVEDAKGYQTPEFKLKWALLKILHPSIEWRLS